VQDNRSESTDKQFISEALDKLTQINRS